MGWTPNPYSCTGSPIKSLNIKCSRSLPRVVSFGYLDPYIRYFFGQAARRDEMNLDKQKEVEFYAKGPCWGFKNVGIMFGV